LIAFHEGEETEHVSEWWGHAVDLDFRFLSEDTVSSRLTEAGLQIEAMLRRSPYVGYEVETTRVYLQARKPDLGWGALSPESEWSTLGGSESMTD
jgi:hypothetical protein